MKVQSHLISSVTVETYQIETELYGLVTYIEYVDDKGKITDVTLRDDEGKEIDHPVLLEEIQELVDVHVDPAEEQRRDEKHGLFGEHEDPAN